jgi:hypothetical protein
VQAIVVSSNAVTVTEGMTATFTVKLAFAPAATATVSLSSSNTTSVTVSPASLSFTTANFATAQTVTVSGVADTNTLAENVPVTLSTPGTPNQTVTVTTVDTTTAACDPIAAAPSIASGKHNPGLSCISASCHSVGKGSLNAFTVGGTLYTSIGGGTPVNRATIHIIDANNVDHRVSTATNGNFWYDAPLTFPIKVRASLCPNVDQPMISTVATSGGNCNACHGSGNRIHLP